MSNMTDRLKLYEAILDLIEKKRAETGDPALAESVETVILASQTRELEQEILEHPGALEPWLAPRRRWDH